MRTLRVQQAIPSLPQPPPSSQMWSAVCSAPHSPQHRSMIPSARVHRDQQPRRAHLTQYGPRALMRCPSMTRKRGRTMQTRKATSTRTPKPSKDAPTSPSTPLGRATSVTRHPRTKARPMTPPQHQHRPQRTTPPQNKINRPGRQTPTHTHGQNAGPSQEKCDRSLRRTPVPPCPPSQMNVAPMLHHGQTMPHFGATTSSRLGRGGGYLQRNPGPLPLPQVDRGSADGRFDHVTGGHIQGGAAHVHQGAEDQYRIAPPGGHGDAHHEPGVGHSDMDGDY